MEDSELLEKEFNEYIRTCVLSRRPVNKTDFIIGKTAADSYISFVKVEKLFSYKPDKWKHIKNIFEISSSDKIKDIIQELLNDDDFNRVDSEGTSQYFRSNAIKQYYCFLKTREVIVSGLDSHESCNVTKSHLGLPLQQIYYGAPGTGKSNKINTITMGMPEENVFRTTFHPDSDYSTFVGCYKPTKKRNSTVSQTIVDYSTLVDTLRQRINTPAANITKECVAFGYEYHDSIVKMQEDFSHTIPSLIIDAYKSGSTYDTQVRAGMAVFESYGASICSSDSITYSFVPQAFLKAYIRAYQTTEPVILVIEEINRGNCAQIFGDLFQLLDRNKEGFSEYPIKADDDICEYLKAVLGADSKAIANDEICLPPNLYIWATMNTSDQSLFPIDSAFKRRWDWQYMPIDKGYDGNGNEIRWTIEGATKKYSWWSFLEKINAQIGEATQSEDKKLGFFFCKATDGVISAEKFVGKVIFYLWNDVFKNNGFEGPIFKDVDGKELSFGKFYKSDTKGNAIVQKDKVELFLENLGVETIDNMDIDKDTEEDTADAGKSEHKETLVAVTIDGERLTADGSTQFDLYLEAIRKLGVATIAPTIEAMKYRRKGSPMATKTQVQSLIDSDSYGYVEADGYFFVKGAHGYTLIRVLEDLKKALNLDIVIEYK